MKLCILITSVGAWQETPTKSLAEEVIALAEVNIAFTVSQTIIKTNGDLLFVPKLNDSFE